MTVVRALTLLLCLPAMLSTGLAEAGALLSHRAIYDLSTGSLGSGSMVARVRGRLVVESREECDGFILNQRIVTETVSTQGDETVSDLRIALWESRDGDRLQFSVSSHVDGRLVSEDNGSATLNGQQGGTATFKEPEAKEVALPAGTVFPTTHSLAILKAARDGRKWLPMTVFDGSAEDGPYSTFTAIGRSRTVSAEAGRGASALDGVVSWPVRTAYFLLEQSQSVPDFEIGFNLFDNGVAGDLQLDYGDFVIAGELAQLDPLPDPACTE